MTQRIVGAERASHQQQEARSPFPTVMPFKTWCKLRGISEQTGRRLIAAGKVKVTNLSRRRIGIRSDHDQEYLDSCIREV
jgi:hypothetical protein